MDLQTLELLWAGDIRTFDEIYYAWVPRIYRYCRLFLTNESDVEDAAAETMMLIWMNRKKFETPTHFRNSVYLYAWQRCMDILKKNDPARVSLDVSEVEHHLDGERFSSWVKSMAAAAILGIIDIGINKLDPIYKQVLEMHYKEDMKPAEIAIWLKIPLGTIYDRLNKAKNMLWIILQEEGFSLPNLIIFITLIKIF